MSDVQIWVFGILAFIVLLTLASRLPRGRRNGMPWPVAYQQDQKQYKKMAQASHDTQEVLRQDLVKVREEMGEVRARLESIEQLLRSVD